MKLQFTRDSVAAGDDIDAPHELIVDLPGPFDVDALLALILLSGYLPFISGGKATWQLASGKSIAVIAQEWAEPKKIYETLELSSLDFQEETLKLHLHYHRQDSPDGLYAALVAARDARV